MSPRESADIAAGNVAAGWTLVIPVKARSRAKTRVTLPSSLRESLAGAVARDTIDAALLASGVDTVIVVTDDETLTEELSSIDRVTIRSDDGGGLLEAIDLGLSTADDTKPRAVLLGDLPALRPEELEQVLHVAHSGGIPWFAPDADEVGTVLLAAGPGVTFEPRFGDRSASAHRQAGYAQLEVPLNSGLRRDVDTLEHLGALSEGQVGAHTAAFLRESARDHVRLGRHNGWQSK